MKESKSRTRTRGDLREAAFSIGDAADRARTEENGIDE